MARFLNFYLSRVDVLLLLQRVKEKMTLKLTMFLTYLSVRERMDMKKIWLSMLPEVPVLRRLVKCSELMGMVSNNVIGILE
ncbi:hypothetical protein SD81_016880 [Tolypothrix campylonemoides VB511288]|nr:hypothetical protein SD81_016880 [Tolypothrix campylonemoides VB511288]